MRGQQITEMTEQELAITLNAKEEIILTGSSTSGCPRCGNGFELINFGPHYDVKCKTDSCLRLRFPGKT